MALFQMMESFVFCTFIAPPSEKKTARIEFRITLC
jgi:hypothetical protein